MRFRNKITGNIIAATQKFIDGRDDNVDWELMQEPTHVPPTLAENKQTKIKALQDKFQSQYDAYLAKYPKAEVASFNDKQREAVAYNLDNTTPTPIIDSILARLGEDKATYIKSILDKVKFLAEREGEMVKTRDAIKACTTQADLDAIVV